MRLNEVLFYGRPAEDVLSIFGLSDDLQGLQGFKVLDCPGGPSSFTAMLAAARIDAVACDPLYALSDTHLRLKHAAAQALRSLSQSIPTMQIDLIRNMRISDLPSKYFLLTVLLARNVISLKHFPVCRSRLLTLTWF